MESILSELQHLKFNFYWSSGNSMFLRSLPSTSCAVTVDTSFELAAVVCDATWEVLICR
jgi:hypothetical protein